MGNTGSSKPLYSIEYWFESDKLKASLPPRVDLRRSHCFPYPVPQDQGTEGSCVVHAMTCALLCAQRRSNISVEDSKVYPIGDLFHQARSVSSMDRPETKGITFSEAMAPIAEDAVWFRLGRSIDNFRQCLQAGYPIVIGFAVTKRMREWQDNPSAMRNTTYVLPFYTNNEAMHGYHSVLLVGYDNEFEGGVFIARNSWGNNWGHEGHFFFPYKTVENPNILLDAMVVDIQ